MCKRLTSKHLQHESDKTTGEIKHLQHVLYITLKAFKNLRHGGEKNLTNPKFENKTLTCRNQGRRRQCGPANHRRLQWGEGDVGRRCGGATGG